MPWYAYHMEVQVLRTLHLTLHLLHQLISLCLGSGGSTWTGSMGIIIIFSIRLFTSNYLVATVEVSIRPKHWKTNPTLFCQNPKTFGKW